MTNTNFIKKTALFLSVVLLISCDKDFNTIGADIVGDENFSTGTDIVDVKAFNQKVNTIQTNNLPINKLGIYDNAVFGNTRANFVTQLSLPSGSIKPTFTSHVVIDSVVLTVPYYSKFVSNEAISGENKYTLDSIYPKSNNQAMNLKVFESGYYLRDFDPNDNLNTQKYYSNQDNDFNAAKIGLQLNDSTNTAENTLFIPSKKEYVNYKTDPNTLKRLTDVDSRSAPRMRLRMNRSFFKTKIIDRAMNTATAGDFDNNNAFKDYFRGLYFQVQAAGSGTMMSLDFTRGDVVIYYKQDKVKEVETNPVPGVDKREIKSFTMTMSGTSVNLLDNSGGSYLAAVNGFNATTGDATLYINGGVGSTAFIDIPAADILRIKNNKWLINDASLTFTIDDSKIPNPIVEPQRVYLYNAEKNRPVIDYYFDGSSNTINPKYNKFVHGGLIETQTSGNKRGIKYKIRITEHLNNIVNKDSANVRLGLMVTENINEVRSVFLKTPVFLPNQDPLKPNIKFDRMPVSSITNPLGTVLFGTNIAPANPFYDKRIKLEIHYTKPNN